MELVDGKKSGTVSKLGVYARESRTCAASHVIGRKPSSRDSHQSPAVLNESQCTVSSDVFNTSHTPHVTRVSASTLTEDTSSPTVNDAMVDYMKSTYNDLEPCPELCCLVQNMVHGNQLLEAKDLKPSDSCYCNIIGLYDHIQGNSNFQTEAAGNLLRELLMMANSSRNPAPSSDFKCVRQNLCNNASKTCRYDDRLNNVASCHTNNRSGPTINALQGNGIPVGSTMEEEHLSTPKMTSRGPTLTTSTSYQHENTIGVSSYSVTSNCQDCILANRHLTGGVGESCSCEESDVDSVIDVGADQMAMLHRSCSSELSLVTCLEDELSDTEGNELTSKENTGRKKCRPSAKKRRRMKKQLGTGNGLTESCQNNEDDDSDYENDHCGAPSIIARGDGRIKSNSESSSDPTVIFVADGSNESDGEEYSKQDSEASILDSGHASMTSESSSASLNNVSSVEELPRTQNVLFTIGGESDSDEDTWRGHNSSNRATFTIGVDEDDEDDEDFLSYDPIPPVAFNSSTNLTTQPSTIGDTTWDNVTIEDPRHPFNASQSISGKDAIRVLPRCSSSPDVLPNSLDALNFIWNFRISMENGKLDRPASTKKVHFAEGDAISTTYDIGTCIDCDFRKGPWEEFAMDRFRFEHRIEEVESVIGYCFKPEHRWTVYNQFFAPADSTSVAV